MVNRPIQQMACSEEADEDFKLPLRPWLEKQINSRKYKGLEWVLTGNGDKQFKLPWVKKNLPDWEEYYMIFRAWAEHRGRGVNSLDDSKAKSNFRCALNKSVDFEEVTSKSKLQLQTGNYKVYRILSPREVRERKTKRSRLQTKEEPGATGSSSFDSNFDSADFKTVDRKDLDFLKDVESSMEISSMDVDDCMPKHVAQPIAPDLTSMDTEFSLISDGIACTQMILHHPESEDLNSILAISPIDGSGNVSQLSPETSQQNPRLTSPGHSSSACCGEVVEFLLAELEKCDIKRERLHECDLVIRYDNQVVYNTTLHSMHLGYRIFYGNPDEQIRLLRMRNATDEKLSDFGLQGIQLPRMPNMSSQVSTILDKTELGIVVRYDPTNLSIVAKRLCQSQVFFFDRQDKAGPAKLEREDNVTLFSHVAYLTDMISQHVGDTTQSLHESGIHLAVGIKPKSLQSMHHMKGLRIELIPHLLKILCRNRDPCNSLSLCFSNPNSMEQFMRQVKRNAVTAS